MKTRHLLTVAAALLWAGAASAQLIQPGANVLTPTENATLMGTQNSDNVLITGGAIGTTRGLSSANGLLGTDILDNSDHFFDQRNEGAAVTLVDGVNTIGPFAFAADRWRCAFASGSNGATPPTVQRVTASANMLTANSIKLTTGATAGSSTPAGLLLLCQQSIPASAIYDVMQGTATAGPLSYSFMIKASVAGIYNVALMNQPTGATRTYVSPCVVASANVAQACTGTFPGDNAGTWTSTFGSIGAGFQITLAAGSTYQGVAGNGNASGWQTGNLPATTTQTQLVNTASATVELSAIKLERGLVSVPGIAAPPPYLAYATVRDYYRKTFPVGTPPAAGATRTGAICTEANLGPAQISLAGTPKIVGLQVFLEPPMFAAPTVSVFNPVQTAASNFGNTWQDMANGIGVPMTADFYRTASASGVMLTGTHLGMSPADIVCGHATFDTGN